MVKIKEEFCCSKCKNALGEKQNNWVVYPSPVVCPYCGIDNTKKLFEFVYSKRKNKGNL